MSGAPGSVGALAAVLFLGCVSMSAGAKADPEAGGSASAGRWTRELNASTPGSLESGRNVLRGAAARGAPVETRFEDAVRDPDRSVWLMNPGNCILGGGAIGGVISLGCLFVVLPVDLVALPVRASLRGQDRDAIRVEGACGVEDPAKLVGEGLAERMIQDHGFSPSGHRDVPAVELVVRTTTFRVAPRPGWQGRVELSYGSLGVVWSGSCIAEGPANRGKTTEEECESVREEVPDLVHRCVEAFARQVRGALDGAREPEGRLSGLQR
jgi:hypothetical protein